jgi:hypothetical protein
MTINNWPDGVVCRFAPNQGNKDRPVEPLPTKDAAKVGC